MYVSNNNSKRESSTLHINCDDTRASWHQGEMFVHIDTCPRQFDFELLTIKRKESRIIHCQIYILAGIFIHPGCRSVEITSPALAMTVAVGRVGW